VDFTNTVIIMTSNLGSEFLLKALSTGKASKTTIDPDTRELVMNAVRRHFRPEFLNRLDDIVMFHPLGPVQLVTIVKIQLNQITKRLAERDIDLELSQKATEYVLEVSYDPVFGARPLRRYLEKNVGTQLSKMLLSGELDDHAIVRIDVASSGDGLAYKVEWKHVRDENAPASAAPATKKAKETGIVS